MTIVRGAYQIDWHNVRYAMIADTEHRTMINYSIMLVRVTYSIMITGGRRAMSIDHQAPPIAVS